MWKQDLKDLVKTPVTTIAVIIIAVFLAMSVTSNIPTPEARAFLSNEKYREIQALEQIAKDTRIIRQKLERCNCK